MTAPRIPNPFSVPELKEKILFTLLCLFVYRIGAHVTLPYVNAQATIDFFRNQNQTLFGVYNLFVGGALAKGTVFALGIMPYISASIFYQILAPSSRPSSGSRRKRKAARRSPSGRAT